MYIPLHFCSNCAIDDCLSGLDPNVKDTYTRHQWDAVQFEAGMCQLEEMVNLKCMSASVHPNVIFKFNTYYAAPTTETTRPAPSDIVQISTEIAFAHYGASFLVDAVQSFQNLDHSTSDAHEELACYLHAGPERSENIVLWWGIGVFPFPSMTSQAHNAYSIRAISIQPCNTWCMTFLPFKGLRHLQNMHF